MKHYNNRSKKHYNNRSKKHYNSKKNKTKKRGGGFLSSALLNIPGFGSVGTCEDKQIYNSTTGNFDTQKCYEVKGNKIYKTVQSSATQANGTNTKAWYNFW